jgi:putative transposase
MRVLRDRTPDRIHLLTCRTRASELLLVPEAELNNCVGGVLAKYAALYKINVYGVCVLSNHYHILASSADGQISIFAENINREIAKRVNRLLKRKGSFWGRRYDDQVTVEVEDGLEALLYLLTNPTKHGLVSHAKDWPGLTTYWQVLGEAPKSFRFLNYSKYTSAKRLARLRGEYVRRSDYETEHVLKISPLPEFADLSSAEAREKLSKEIEKRTRKLVKERRKAGLGFLGRKAVLRQKRIGVFPRETNETPRPACYSKSAKAIAVFKKELARIREAYTLASIKYRLGVEGVEFPPYCFYPPRHHIPSVAPG